MIVGGRFQVSDFKFTFQVSRTRLDANRPKTHPARKLELCMVNLQCAISRARTPGFAISARFTVQIHRSKASHGCRIANLGDFRGLAIVICHLCTLHRVNSAFKLLPQTPFAISARFTVQIHRPKASHGCRIATLGDTEGLACRNLAISAAFTVQIHASGNRPLHSFCHLCSFHRADPRFKDLAPEARK